MMSFCSNAVKSNNLHYPTATKNNTTTMHAFKNDTECTFPYCMYRHVNNQNHTYGPINTYGPLKEHYYRISNDN